MRHRIAVGAFAAAALLLSSVVAGEGLKSGPQVGSKKIVPFNPEHITGSTAGTKECLV
jgi:hypothetical protein